MKYPHFSFPGKIFTRIRGTDTAQLGMTLAIGSVIFNGTYNAFAKGLTDFLSPVSLLLLSELLTAGFVILGIGIVPLMRILGKMRGKEFMAAMLVGALSSGIGPLLWFQGLSETTAVNASLLNGSSIIFMLFFGYIFLKEGINFMQGVGMLIVTGGIAVITVGQYGYNFTLNPGDGYIILSTGVISLGTIVFKKYLQDVHPQAALFVRNMSGILIALSLAAFIKHPFIQEIRSFPMAEVVILLCFGFFSRFLNLTFFYGSLQRISATKMALINQATPLASVFFAILILQEQIYTYHVLGITFIIFGLMLEQMSTERVTHATKMLFLSRAYQHHTP